MIPTKYRPNVSSVVQEQMDKLCKEIIKCKFMYHYCNNSMLSSTDYDKLVYSLRQLENLYPSFIRSYSPLKMVGFEEKKARDAFGAGDWPIIRRTWQLAKIDEEEEFFYFD